MQPSPDNVHVKATTMFLSFSATCIKIAYVFDVSSYSVKSHINIVEGLTWRG
jgi:hypothetical protein